MAEERADRRTKRQAKRARQIPVLPLYILLIIVFVVYILYQHIQIVADIAGIALLLSIIAIVAVELINGFNEEGLVKNIVELVIVVVAVFALWTGLKITLHTQYPIDVVPSCSMLPSLQRGDILLLQGVSGAKGINAVKAPIVNVTSSSYDSMIQNPGREFVSCVAYLQNGNTAKISQYMEPGYSIGLYSASSYGGSVLPYSYQNNNTIQYVCGVAQDRFANGSVASIVTTNAIKIGGTLIQGDRNNTIAVYATTSKDLFYEEGDSYIVHRIYAVLNVSGNYYFLTKGDNNPGLDIQYGNYPANLSQIEGKVVASVPYLGYLKLILTNHFTEPAGCNSTIQN